MLLLLAPIAATGLLTLLVYLIVFLVVAGLVFWAVRALCGAFGIPAPIQTVITVVLVVICVIALLYFLLGNLPLR
jgi:hypothetical protein